MCATYSGTIWGGLGLLTHPLLEYQRRGGSRWIGRRLEHEGDGASLTGTQPAKRHQSPVVRCVDGETDWSGRVDHRSVPPVGARPDGRRAAGMVDRQNGALDRLLAGAAGHHTGELRLVADEGLLWPGRRRCRLANVGRPRRSEHGEGDGDGQLKPHDRGQEPAPPASPRGGGAGLARSLSHVGPADPVLHPPLPRLPGPRPAPGCRPPPAGRRTILLRTARAPPG